MDALQAKHKSELEYLEEKNKLAAEHRKTLADIEVGRFEQMSKAIGPETLQAIAMAGPELKKKLLDGLGVDQSFLGGGNLPFVGNWDLRKAWENFIASYI